MLLRGVCRRCELSAVKRFSRGFPCPVCAGAESDPRGKGERCWGFLSSDGQYAHCVRVPCGELEKGDTYAHRLDGECNCGTTHGTPAPAKLRLVEPSIVKTTKYEIRNTAGEYIATHIRHDLSDGNKRFTWERGGTLGLGGMPVTDVPLWQSEKVAKLDLDMPVIVTEGQKACSALGANGLYACATVTGAKKGGAAPSLTALEALRGRPVVLWPDHDEVGRVHMEQVAAQLQGFAASVRVFKWGEQSGDDAADFFARGGTEEQLDSLIAEIPEETTPPRVEAAAPDSGDGNPPPETAGARSPLRSYTMNELRSMPRQTRELLVSPIYGRQESIFIYGEKGAGKTWIGGGIALLTAAGAGTRFLNFQAGDTNKGELVLYLDGEMMRRDIENRFEDLIRTSGVDPGDNLVIWTPDAQPEGVGQLNLFTEAGRQLMDNHIEDLQQKTGKRLSTVSVDNLRTLFPGWVENDSDSFTDIMHWTIRLRARMIGSILLHHANKAGGYSGNTAIVTAAAAIVKVSRPKDWTPDMGAYFDVEYEYTRTKPVGLENFNARLEGDTWTVETQGHIADPIIRIYLAQGMSVRDIAKQLGVTRYHVEKIAKAIKDQKA